VLPTVTTKLRSRSPEDTLRIGRSLGREAGPGSVIVVDGDLGTGKTVLARGIAQGLGIRGWRGSPTFNLVHEYVGRLPFFHVDAYRITAAELLDLDLQPMMSAGGIVTIEWGGKMLEVLRSLHPAQMILVRLADAGDVRRNIEIEQ